MALPKLTDEQRKEALAKAAEARKARAELKAALKRGETNLCLLYTSPSPRDLSTSRMPSSA